MLKAPLTNPLLEVALMEQQEKRTPIVQCKAFWGCFDQNKP